MALVVFVSAVVLMLSGGLRRTLVATGSRDNVVVLRAGSESQVQSAVDRLLAGLLPAFQASRVQIAEALRKGGVTLL
jgi:hypothetical protein